MTPSPEDPDAYDAFIRECAQFCFCTDGPCEGVQCGGLCDRNVRVDWDRGERDEDEDDE